MADRNYMKACKAHFEPKKEADSADETVRALRQLSVETGSLACMGCGREHNCGTHGCAILRASADLHEQQQGRIAELEAQLAATQRREQAAVECISEIEKYNIEDLDARHGSIVWIIGKWRGQQEAGK